jgi:glycosyltransferase involved in cell wall biosynthesis
MEDKKPLLSICIPTYNRAEYLDKSIASIVSQTEFSIESVELVVSDNASNDNTREVVKKYQETYKNIYYFRNDKNIRDKNYPIVIKEAHGIFRKLCNDTLVFKDNSLKQLLDVVEKNRQIKPLLFFMNNTNKNKRKQIYAINNFDSFVKTISYWATWIGGFGIWEDDFNGIEDKFAGCELSLWQTKQLFEIAINKRKYFIYNTLLFDTQNLEKKDISYGLYKVFYENYLGLYQPYLTSHVLSDKTFRYLKKHLLLNFFLLWIVIIRYNKEKYQIALYEDIEDRLFNSYKNEKYYRWYCIRLYLKVLFKKFKELTFLRKN